MDEADNMCGGTDRLIAGEAETVKCPICEQMVETRFEWQNGNAEFRRVNKHDRV